MATTLNYTLLTTSAQLHALKQQTIKSKPVLMCDAPTRDDREKRVGYAKAVQVSRAQEARMPCGGGMH
jgi:hypothetical protein